MGQKIASLYAEIGGDVSKLQKALGIAKSELKGTKSGFSEIIRETTGFNLSTLTAAAGVGILTKGFVDAINKTVAYNRQIREMSEFTGMGVEDTSRLVQVADDWAIEIGQVRVALQMMSRQGVKPSIETLANLADEFVALNNPTKFAEKHAKELGRNWSALVPLLAKGGKALRDQAAAVKDNLIATDAEIRATENYRMSVDMLNDSWQGFLMTIGQKAMPWVTDFVNELNELSEAQNWQDVLTTLEKYSYTIHQDRGKMVELGEAGQEAGAKIKGAFGDAEKAVGEVYDAAKAVQTAMGQLTAGMSDALSSETDDFNQSQAEIETKMGKIAARIDELSKKKWLSKDQKAEVAELSGEYRDLAGEYQTNADEHEEATKRILFDILQQQAAIGGLTEQEVGALADIAESWGLIDPATKTAMSAASLFFQSLNSDADLSQEEMEDLRRAMLGLPSSHRFKVFIDIYANSKISPGDVAALTGKQFGGEVTGGKAYVVGEKGPEILLVPPGSKGEIVPNDKIGKAGGGAVSGGGDVYMENYFSISGLDANQVAILVERKLLGRLRDVGAYLQAGGGYAGV